MCKPLVTKNVSPALALDSHALPSPPLSCPPPIEEKQLNIVHSRTKTRQNEQNLVDMRTREPKKREGNEA
eukprot:382795-Hanusia_phi.AAC.3